MPDARDNLEWKFFVKRNFNLWLYKQHATANRCGKHFFQPTYLLCGTVSVYNRQDQFWLFLSFGYEQQYVGAGFDVFSFTESNELIYKFGPRESNYLFINYFKVPTISKSSMFVDEYFLNLKFMFAFVLDFSCYSVPYYTVESPFFCKFYAQYSPVQYVTVP